uniref:Secreted protein n=1 Tax=Kalanchoe fedtschenkoi TaxID=63787 RepID=A0A7N1A2M0_KALFE
MLVSHCWLHCTMGVISCLLTGFIGSSSKNVFPCPMFCRCFGLSHEVILYGMPDIFQLFGPRSVHYLSLSEWQLVVLFFPSL